VPPALDAEAVEPLVSGVSLLGSGGGGEAGLLGELLRRRLGDRSIELHSAAQLAGCSVVPVGVVGATGVVLEKLPSGGELAGAVQAVCRWAGVAPGCVMSIEVGGLNGLAGLLAALDLEVPYLDADLMGRAMPRLDQFSWAVEGVEITPCALVEPGGQLAVLDRMGAAATERAVRAFISGTGGWAALALCPLPVDQAGTASIQGSLGRAIALGRAHLALGPSPSGDELEAALPGGRVLGAGRVLEVTRHGARGGFSRGSVTVRDATSGAVVRVESENEYLVAMVDGVVTAAVPDVLCLLDRRTARPIATDRIRPGNEVLVVTIPGPDWWSQTPERAAAVGPAAFGYPDAAVTDAAATAAVSP
jgi:DUF917 family protein